MKSLDKIGLGGGCHWCTEAVFQSLKGVYAVDQGFIRSVGVNSSFSEAVVVHFNSHEIALEVLLEIHLYTHQSTVYHSMRNKYRSAVYVYKDKEIKRVGEVLRDLQDSFDKKIITQVLPFKEFTPSDVQFHDYYFSNTTKPFCKTYIAPKLSLLMQQFAKHVDKQKVKS